MYSGALFWIRSFLACWALLAVALLYYAIGYLVPCTLCDPSMKPNRVETAKQNATPELDTDQPELGSSLLKNSETMNTALSRYCCIEKCKIITCSFIETRDPGEVMKDFIEDTFKVRCNSSVAVSIIFIKSAFSNNELRKRWLLTDLAIDELTIENCFLTKLNENAFSSAIFKKTTKLFLKGNNISVLKRGTFRHLRNLKYFGIIDNNVSRADRNLLKDVGSSLQTLQFERAIGDAEVLRNVTGKGPLPAVQTLSLRYNDVPIIDRRLFSGVPNVVSLYLTNSHVKTVGADTFADISESVKQIFMNENLITTLPEGLFDRIIQRRKDFGLTIHKNLWHCDCRLKWIRDMMRDHPSVMKENLTCSSPVANAGKSFFVANFCNETSTTDDDTISTNDATSTAISVSSSTTESSGKATTNIKCDNLTYQIRSRYSHHVLLTLEVPSGFRNFSATDLMYGDVRLTIPDSDNVALLWFNNSERPNLENSIHCVSEVRHTHHLKLQPETSYTICLLNNSTFTPLNCLGLTTRSSKLHIDKIIIIAIFVVSLTVACFVSALLMFIMVRRNPAMLKGNKRIMIVKRRTLDAIVLPQGLSSDTIESEKKDTVSTISRKFKEDLYVVPSPPLRNSTQKISRNSSTSSVESDPSYISVTPTLSQLNSWSRKRILYINSEAGPQSSPRSYHNIAQTLSAASDMHENIFEDCIL